MSFPFSEEKNHIKQGFYEPQYCYLLTVHELGLVSHNLKETVMRSRLNIYAHLQLPLIEVLKTLEGWNDNNNFLIKNK